MREKPGLVCIALFGDFVEHLIFFNLKRYPEQMFCFCRLRNLVTFRKPTKDVVQFF